MSNKPDLSTLPERMRYAADVIDEYIAASPVLHPGEKFSSGNLRIAADRLHERRDRQVWQLAAILREARIRGDYEDYARQLIEAGWHKGDRR